jgi:histidinol-phosphate aminotransferase
MTWQKFLRPSLAAMAAYDVPPSEAPTQMHANERAQPWSAAAREAVAQAVAGLSLERYPDTSGRKLRARLADQHGVSPDRVVLGVGSDEIITLLAQALSGARPSAMLIPNPSFVMYEHAAVLAGLEPRTVELDENFELDESAMRRALDPGDVSLCFLARPNNPTSSLWDARLIESLIQDHPQTVFVVDEAYAAYSPRASMWRADRPSNYVHMSTLSKVGLAGLRLGFCVASSELAHELNKIRHPYNIPSTTLVIAEVILRDFAEELEEAILTSRQCRDELVRLFARITGVHVFPAYGNMLLARCASPEAARKLCADLAEHGVLIKYAGGWPRLRDCVRASVGTKEDLSRAEQALLATGWIPG